MTVNPKHILDSKAYFYQDHLNRVSRSFAFCIEQLNQPLRSWVGLSYLLCRVVDTVEDSKWENPLEQKRQFSLFNQFILQPLQRADVWEWVQRFPKAISDSEKLLLEDSAVLFEDLHALPDSVKEALQKPIQSMCVGMSYFQKHRLKDLNEVNQYCFFVAGVVGELLTQSLVHAHPDLIFQNPADFLEKSYFFGRYLQKINLLKDQGIDEYEGRFFIPSQKEVLASTLQDARISMDYLEMIPLEAKNYRIFCAWSLFLGLVSLGFTQKAWSTGISEKNTRTFTHEFVKAITEIIDHPHDLREKFEDLYRMAGGTLGGDAHLNSSRNQALPMKELYFGDLTDEALKRLGML